jgi:hypothetical protein
VQMWASVTVFVTANDVERCVCWHIGFKLLINFF